MGENEIRNLADSHAGIDEWKKAGFNELQVLEITKVMIMALIFLYMPVPNIIQGR